jgi:hypothetical protein
VRPTNRMNLKASTKFKGDNLRQYMNSRNLEHKVRSGLLAESKTHPRPTLGSPVRFIEDWKSGKINGSDEY